jgi:hypothetical protein
MRERHSAWTSKLSKQGEFMRTDDQIRQAIVNAAVTLKTKLITDFAFAIVVAIA